MNFEEWLESKGHIDGYRTDYQSAYDGGFDEGVKTQQAKIAILQIKLNGADERADAVLNHKNKMIDGLQARIGELQKHSLMLREAAKSWSYNEGEKNILISQADDLDRILKGNKDETGLN